MSLTSKEAAETLSDVERATRKSAQAFGYSRAAPHLILWGVIQFVGYAATDLRPAWADWIWLVLVLAGCTAGAFIGRKQGGTWRGGRMFGLVLIIFVFIFASYAILQPTYGNQLAAFPALIAGSIYAGVGLWLGLRYVAAGAFTIALTVGGFFFLREHYLLWMAFVGGGGLILPVSGSARFEAAMEQPDPIIHQPVRLKIMSALRVLPANEPIEFVRLKAIVAATEGNLGAHVTTLEEAGYVSVAKDFAGKKPRTRIALTKKGRKAFEDYLAYLREIVDLIRSDAFQRPAA